MVSRVWGMPDASVKSYSHDGEASSTEGDICIRFGKRLRKLRTERGCTQTDVAVHRGMGSGATGPLDRLGRNY
jgi:hypothetical protein